ncbi:MAG: tetratricopeptide repeat protein [Desulfobulbaceae bacterium]|nr:tetratricopeptide repeat protein [Desulfobulbaceae bacterium]
MKIKYSFHTVIFCFLFTFCAFITTGSAESFPFRSVSPGDTLPATTVTSINSGKEMTIGQHTGRPTVLVFWGGDLPTKKQRAITALTQLHELAPFLKEKKVDMEIINALGDTSATITEVTSAAGISGETYVDQDQKTYGSLGIFVMPAIMLVDPKGKIVTGMGYSHNMIPRLQGEIEILLGEKTREQLEKDLHPTMVDKSEEEKDANRHLNMGKIMTMRGQLEPAVREFKSAIEKNPKLGAAQIELGCLYVQLDNLTEAQKALDLGLEMEPGSLEGEICYAQIQAKQGKVDEAIGDLQALSFRNGRNPDLHYVLGTLLVQKGAFDKAAAELSKAYELLNKQKNFEH